MKLIRAAIVSVLIVLVAGCRVGSGGREGRYLATGQRYMAKQDYTRAVLEFRNATKAAPGSAEAHYHLGTALLAVGDAVSGVKELMRCTELDPKHAAGQAKLAELMLTSRNPDVLKEARKRAQAAFEANPDDVAALDAMAAVSWNRDQPEESEQFLERALQRIPGHLQSAVMLANVKLATRDYAGAEEALRKAVEAAPNTPETRMALAALYRTLRRSKDAEEQLQQAVSANPEYGPALLELARLRVIGGKKDDAEALYKRIAALPNPAYRPAYALFLLYLVDVNRGAAELERLYGENPQSRDLRTRLVAAYLFQKRWSDADKILTQAIGKNASDVAALTQRGELLTITGRHREAERDLTKVLQYDPRNAAAHTQLAGIYAARNEPLRQRQELAEALRLEPGSLRSRLALATEHLRAKAPKTALELLDQAPEYQRSSPDYLKVRIWALLETGRLDEAGKWIQAGLARGKDAELTLQSANLRFRRKDPVGARALVESVLKDNPADVAALQALMETYAATGQTSAGIQRLKSHAARQTSSAQVQMLLATWLKRAGDFSGARAGAQAAVTADPNAIAPRLMCAELDLIDNRIESARRNLAALPGEQQTRPETQMLLALLEQQAGNYSRSIEHLRAVVTAAPKSVPALNNLAYLLVDYANRPDEGLKYAQQVKELAPEDYTVDDTIGWAFFAKGLYPTAVSHLERAAARNGKSAVTRYHLAMAYQKAGEKEKAQQALTAATRLDPNAPERKRAADLISGALR